MKRFAIVVVCLALVSCGGSGTETGETGSTSDQDTPSVDPRNGFETPEAAFSMYREAFNAGDWDGVARTFEPIHAGDHSMGLSHYISQNSESSGGDIQRWQDLESLTPQTTAAEDADRYNAVAFPWVVQLVYDDADAQIARIEGIEVIDSDGELAYDKRARATEVVVVHGEEVEFPVTAVYSEGAWWIMPWSADERRRRLDTLQ